MAEALADNGYGWFTPADLATVIEAIHSLPDWQAVILVGGQSLTAWALYFKIAIPEHEGPYLTADADFVASRKDAHLLADVIVDSVIKPRGMDDHTPNTAIITFPGAEGTKLHIDLLDGVLGVKQNDLRRLSTPFQIGNYDPIAILHPLLVLQSRCANLRELPSKRNMNRRVQALVAIDVVKAYLSGCLADPDRKREALKAAKRIVKLAKRAEGIFVWTEYGIDVISTVDAAAMPDGFDRSWSQELVAVDEKRASAMKLKLRLKTART